MSVAVAVNTMTAGSFKHDVTRGTPLQSNVVSPSPPKASAAMRTPAASTTVGAEGVSPTEVTEGMRGATVLPSASSPNVATAARVYTLLGPHDVFLTHVVHNPTKAESMVRAARVGTALRYPFLASIVSGDNL
ncbi:hypothetical protein NXY56_000327 [Leishmania guyanensis]